MISFRRPIIPFQGEDAMRFRDEALVLVRQGVLIERLSENFFAVVLSSRINRPLRYFFRATCGA